MKTPGAPGFTSPSPRLIVVVLMLGLYAGTMPARAAIYVSGVVSAAGAPSPASGVTVGLYPVSASQDPSAENPVDLAQTLHNGSFVLKVPAAGRYRIRIESEAYLRYDQELDVPARGIPSQTIWIERRPAVRMKLIAPGGAAAPGQNAEAWITFAVGAGQRLGDRRYGDFRTREVRLSVVQAIGEDGTLNLTLPDGFTTPAGVTVGARVAGTGIGERPYNHLPQQTVVIRLQHGASLHGVVLDREGKPFPRLPLIIISAPPGAIRRSRETFPAAVTDGDGRFEVKSLLPGEYLIRAHAHDGSRYAANVEVAEPSSSIILRPAGD